MLSLHLESFGLYHTSTIIMHVLFSRRLWLNLALIGLLIVGLVFGTLLWLKIYTLHGKTHEVPELVGYPLSKLDEVLADKSFTYAITDSVYSDELPRGSVLQQNPRAGQQVKEGRIIYLTATSTMPEMAVMPDLMGKSRRMAIPVLEISGLQLESLSYRPDDSCTDCVIDQLHRGKSIEPGAQIRKGERITLVLGQRSAVKTKVPRLLGLSYADAYALLNAYSLNMGEILSCENCPTADDTVGAYVINQSPVAHEDASLGSFVDLYLSTDSLKAEEFIITAPNIDTLKYQHSEDSEYDPLDFEEE